MLSYAIRGLRNSPGYTVACIAVLALGIGANTAIFSLVDTVLLKPLPYADADRLVFAWEKVPNMPEPLTNRMPPSRVTYRAWRGATSFTGMAAFIDGFRLTERGVERPQNVKSAYVSADLLPLLGTQPSLGRTFHADEETPGRDRVLIISDGYFTQRFQRDPAAIGKTITFQQTDYTVIGVLPRGFHLPVSFEGDSRNEVDVFIPLSRRWTGADANENYFTILSVVARLKPGVTAAQARTELSSIIKSLEGDPKRMESTEATVFSFLTEDRNPGTERQLYILLGAVGFLLLIACANLANLTLARATQRSREVAVRLALGATRARIAAQLLTESLLVSLAGAAAGLIIAMWIVSGVLLIAPEGLDRPDLVEFRWPVFVFAAAAGVLTAVLFGIVPAWSASRTGLNASLKAGDRAATSATSRGRQLLTAAEVAIALILLTGAGLLIRSVANLFETGVGFDTSNLAFVDVDLPDARYKDEASRRRFLTELQREVRAIPGVQSAGISNTLPLHRVSWRTFSIAGRPKPAKGTNPLVDWASVSPEYVSVIGLPLLAGRRLTAADAARNAGKGDGVSLVNQAFADQYLRGENPLDHRIVFDDDRLPAKERAYQIVGVVGDFRATGPNTAPRPQFFQAGVDDSNTLLALRTAVPAESLNEEVRQAFWRLDKELPLVELQRMDHYFYRSINETGLQTILLTSFAALGLLLAMIGVHSVLAASVASRTREIGIRMALGASPKGIGRMIAGQSAWPLALGVVAGVLGSLGLSSVLEAQLFNVAPRDPLTFVLAIVAVLIVAPFAIWLPVRRATRVECTEALREE